MRERSLIESLFLAASMRFGWKTTLVSEEKSAKGKTHDDERVVDNGTESLVSLKTFDQRVDKRVARIWVGAFGGKFHIIVIPTVRGVRETLNNEIKSITQLL